VRVNALYRKYGYFQPHRGAVLLLALVFMLMLAMITATVMRTAIMQLHMAGNDQFLEEAFHHAQAVVTELSLDATNFQLDTQAGDVNCSSLSAAPECDLKLLPQLVHTEVPEGIVLDYRVTRQQPLLLRGFPIRESMDKVSSSTRFDAAIFEISARIDGSSEKLGNAHIVQGIAVRVPASR
jgi:hypothetical protein